LRIKCESWQQCKGKVTTVKNRHMTINKRRIFVLAFTRGVVRTSLKLKSELDTSGKYMSPDIENPI